MHLNDSGEFAKHTLLVAALTHLQGGPKKWHKVYGTIILQPYITESCGFQQNVLKEILYMTKVIV